MIPFSAVDPSMLQFLDTISPSKVKCKHPACGEMASSHERSFLHGGNSVTVSSSRLNSYQYLDNFVWIWSDSPYSNACVKIPSSALHLSLSHFLLLLLQTRCITDISMQNILSVHIKQRDILVCFRMEGCSLYSIHAPTSIDENFRQQRLWLQGECKSLEKVRNSFMLDMIQLLSRISNHTPLPNLNPRSFIRYTKSSRW